MSPPPTDSDLAHYYAAYTRTDGIDLRSGLGSKYPRLRRYYHVLSGDVDPRDFVFVPKNGRVLDYGSGEGTYLLDFHQRGVDISGAEITDVLIAACREKGLSVRKTLSFDAIPFADDEFDVVYLMQVFEHLRHPRAFMLELFRILKEGGMLYLAVPNAASIWRRVFGLNWVSGWFAPFHLAHFTAEALGKIGSDCGLEMCTTWSRTPESWFRLNLKAVLYPRDNNLDVRKCWLDRAIFRYPLLLLLRFIECFVSERDCLVVTFRKPSR